ncbi:MAG TPA: SAM-dependent methyltransferase [Ideonella sp.]|uniref:class I SAM-dependent methyltransferase n=1 Tax=Ideonella sp. TaxID=1929293 RepID=UPI002C82364C|nr:SAM-dependent methyltransferase [Ideonella sp.]HSI50113.1 SAM-dependent methyltransferase [Ideonella sp.]
MRKSQPDSVSVPPEQRPGEALPGAASADLRTLIAEAITVNGGWLPFDRFMAMALYQPGLGYYANSSRKFGLMPQSGSDFVTAPELTPLFGQALAVQVAQALRESGTTEIFEFGAGSGALAEQLISALDALGQPLTRYTIIDLSGTLRARQALRLARFGERVSWASEWPAAMQGVVVGNEVLDAMPVQLLVRQPEGGWHERGVVLGEAGELVFADRPSELTIPFIDVEGGPVLPGMVTEIHPQAEAFIHSLAEHLQRGAAFFLDYGFPEAEYYHLQRHQGTLIAHRLHQVDHDPLGDPGEKDLTAHVNFTGIALAGQQAGLDVIGYTSQAHFLFNCGIAEMMAGAELRERAMGQKLVTEHEMGELFKVIAFATPGLQFNPLGFAHGDRMHRL